MLFILNFSQTIPLTNYLKIAFSIVFGLLVCSFYLYTHPEYLEIVNSPPRFQIFLMLLLAYSVPLAINKFLLSKLQNFKLPVLIPILLTFAAGLYFPQYFFLKEIGYLKGADFAFYTGLIAASLGGVLWIVVICWLTGAVLDFSLGDRSPNNLQDIMLQTAKGIMAFTLVLFLLGKFNMLHSTSLWIYSGIILTLSAVFRKKIFHSIKLGPSKIADFSYWDHLLIFGIVTILAANFIEQLRPIPTGYDGMTVYANLSFLLADYKHLVTGFGAYNWPLFASSGLVLFKKPEMVLMANFQIVVLAMITFYLLLKNHLGKTPALLGVLLVAALPSLNRMVYMQQKVEGAYLFFTLILIIQVLQLLKTPQHKWLIFQIGLTAGFLFGIKPTSILLIIPLVIGLWYITTGYWGLIAATCGAMVILMNANLDFFSGLSMFNSPSQSYIWILAATLLISLIILFVQNKNSMWLAIKTTAIITTALILAFSPWAYKNIQEIEQISITGIIQGRTSIHLIQ